MRLFPFLVCVGEPGGLVQVVDGLEECGVESSGVVWGRSKAVMNCGDGQIQRLELIDNGGAESGVYGVDVVGDYSRGKGAGVYF